MKLILSIVLSCGALAAVAEKRGLSNVELLNEPVTLVSPQYGSLPPACRVQWRTIAGVGATRTAELISSGDLKLNPQCKAFESQLFWKDLIEFPYDRCVKKSMTDHKDCKLWLMIYRASIIDQMTKPKANEKEDLPSYSTAVLANKQAARFFDPALMNEKRRQDSLYRLEAINEILRDRLPQSYDMAKWAILLHTLQLGLENEKGKLDNNRVKKLLAMVDMAEKMNPNDPELAEVRWLVLKMEDKTSEFEMAVNEYIKLHPNQETGYYYLASVYWNMKDRSKTVKALQAASRKFPSSMRIKNALDKAKNEKFGSSILDVKVNAPFGDL